MLDIFWLTVGVFFCLGLIFGSFTNALVWRGVRGKSIARGRSQCVHCDRQLRWFENIPLASFIFLRGRCATCHTPIPWQYPLIELGGGCLYATIAVFSGGYFSVAGPVVRDIFFISIGLIIFASDAQYQIIFSSVAWVGALLGLILNLFFPGPTLLMMALGALVGGGFFGLQYIISHGRWIGGGDVRLGVMLGIWLGWRELLVALFIAYMLGAAIGVALLATGRRQRTSQIAFGTFLIIGAGIAHWYGEPIIRWYSSLLYGLY